MLAGTTSPCYTQSVSIAHDRSWRAFVLPLRAYIVAALKSRAEAVHQLLGSNSLAAALLSIQCGVLQPRLLLPLTNAVGRRQTA